MIITGTGRWRGRKLAQTACGVDYAYTLQGWLKGMNADSLSSRNDMGRDGDTSNTRRWVARDVVGYAINYYNGDYAPIGTTLFDKDLANTSAYAAGSPGLFNGNIRAITVHNISLSDGKPIGYAYSYDQLHRLKAMDAWKGSGANSLWQTTAAVLDYQERVTYDGNGNIQTYRRNATGSAVMDSLRYVYNQQTNQLQFVTDSVPAGAFPNDVDSQGANNYVYDAAGNMKTDASQGVTVAWGPYGKILSVGKTVSPTSTLIYGYDPMQHRAMKAVIKGTDTLKTYYIRDAQGNVMGVYTRHNDSVSWREQYIYGYARLGLYRADTLINKGLQSINKLYEGKRQYELTNHLGNVMAVINDRRTDSLIGTVKTYNAVVVSASDYYPFGLTIDSRNYSSSIYRYGFNGKENDKEWGAQDYGMRIYVPGLGRFLSLDPIARRYPELTPYQFASNTPIVAIDIDGLEAGIDLRMDRWDADRASGKKTAKQIENEMFWTGMGGVIGGAMVFDAFVTKGYATRALMGLDILNAISADHAAGNIKGNSETKTALRKEAGDGYKSFLIGYGVSKALGLSARAWRLFNIRRDLAYDFYKINATFMNESKIIGEVNAINANYPVETVILPKGTNLIRFAKKDELSGEILQGSYFALPGANPNKLGISLDNRFKVEITLEEDTKFLRSTTNDAKAWEVGSTEIYKGGEIQLFQPNAKYRIDKVSNKKIR